MQPDEFIFPQPCKKLMEKHTVQEMKCLNLTDQQKLKLELSRRKTRSISIAKNKIKKKVKCTSPVFAAEPKEIVFKNFELNVTYEVTFYNIKNFK